MKLLWLCFILIFSACSFKKSPLENQTQNGHSQLYSEPEAPAKQEDPTLKRIVIAATNDLHGHYGPEEVTFKDKFSGKQFMQIGGVAHLSSYFSILKKEYGDFVLVDSGDIFPAKSQELTAIQDFYSQLGYHALTVGLKDFNLKLPSRYKSGPEFFKAFSEKSKTPLLLSNFYEVKTGRVVEWPGTQPYVLKEVNGVKVGIIGLVPDDVVEQTPVDNRMGFYVENMLQSTLRHARLLRSIGAELIVVLTHQGLNCGEELSQSLKLPVSKVNFDPSKSDLCDLSSKLGVYLNRLPYGLVDLVVAGRNHQKVANMVNNVAVISGFEDSKSFSYVEFHLDSKTRKLQREKTVIHQPVMVCHEFFKETDDCYTEDPSVDHKVRTEAKFLGHPVKPDAAIGEKFKTFMRKSAALPAGKVQTLTHLEDQAADIAYTHRTAGEAPLMLLTVSGKQLLKLLEQEYNEGNGADWYPATFQAKADLLEIKLNGKNIDNEQSYKILADVEDLQRHPLLKRQITRIGNQLLVNKSWIETEADTVSTSMAASEAVR